MWKVPFAERKGVHLWQRKALKAEVLNPLIVTLLRTAERNDDGRIPWCSRFGSLLKVTMDEANASIGIMDRIPILTCWRYSEQLNKV